MIDLAILVGGALLAVVGFTVSRSARLKDKLRDQPQGFRQPDAFTATLTPYVFMAGGILLAVIAIVRIIARQSLQSGT